MLNIAQFVLLVDVHQGAAVDGLEETGHLDFMGLKNNIAIAQDGSRSPLADMPDYFEGFVANPFGEGVIEQKAGELKQVQIVRVFYPVFLQCAQVIGVTEAFAKFFEDAPVGLRVPGTDLALQKSMDVISDAIIGEERVIDVEEENDVSAGAPGEISFGGA